MPKELYTTGFLADTSLQGYWRLETDGTDSSTNSYTLTGSGTPSHVAAKFGNGFDAELDTPTYYYRLAADTANLNLTGSFTIGGWFKPESLDANASFVDRDSGGNATGGYGVLIQTNGSVRLIIRGDDDASHTNDSAASLITVGSWHFIAVTLDSSADTITHFTDGLVKVTTGITYVPKTSSADFGLGYRYEVSNSPADGVIDDVFIFNRALSVQEIASIYRGGSRVMAVL